MTKTYCSLPKGNNEKKIYKFRKGEIAITKWQEKPFFVFIHIKSIRNLFLGDESRTIDNDTIEQRFQSDKTIPIYWISFPGFRGRIASQFRWWAKESELIKVTGITLKTYFGKRLYQKSNTPESPVIKSLIHEDKEDVEPRILDQQRELLANYNQWWVTPYTLRKGLNDLRDQVLAGTFIEVPKMSRFNVLSIVSSFQTFVDSLSNQPLDYSSQNDNHLSHHLHDPMEWIIVWVLWFDTFFLDLGTYTEAEYNNIIDSIEKHGKLSSRLSEVLGIEHFARCLDENILVQSWLKYLNPLYLNSLDECKKSTQLFLRYLATIFDDYAGSQIYGDIEEII